MVPSSLTTSVKAIEIESLALKGGDSVLFSGLTISLDAGEKAILTAPSGFGKSTLLRCLLGFVIPTAGQVRIFNALLTPHSAWTLRTRMAYVDQEPDLGNDSVEAELLRPFRYKKNQHLRFDSDRVASLMNQLLLPLSLLNKKTSSLSGGEKQRVALIGALLLERDILLLDEPTSALDQEAGAAVADLLTGMKNLTIFAVSHDPFLVKAFNHRIDLLELCGRAT